MVFQRHPKAARGQTSTQFQPCQAAHVLPESLCCLFQGFVFRIAQAHGRPNDARGDPSKQGRPAYTDNLRPYPGLVSTPHQPACLFLKQSTGIA